MRGSRGYLVAEVVVLVLLALASVARGGPPTSAASPKKIDPEADRLVRQMTSYLASLPSFTVRTAVTDEVSMKSGEKIQIMSNAEVAVERPNRLKSMQVGSKTGLGFWYDGKSMTLACQANNAYQTAPAPPSLDAAIDQMRKQFDIDAPGADLLYSDPYAILMEQVVSGRFIGRETVNRTPANHVAFKGEQIDWQLWIQDGPQPLPLRYVITTKDVLGHPEFAVQLSDWNTRPQLLDSAFEFRPATGAKSAQSVAGSCGGGPQLR
jgi:hypothetical protein